MAGKRDVPGLRVVTAMGQSAHPGLSNNPHRVTPVISSGGGGEDES